MKTVGIVRRRVNPNPDGYGETAAGHIRNALAVLKNLLDSETLGDEDQRKDLEAVVRRLWRALRELERDE